MKARCPHRAPWFAACARCDDAEIMASWEKVPGTVFEFPEVSPETRAFWERSVADYSLWKGPPVSEEQMRRQMQNLLAKCRAEAL